MKSEPPPDRDLCASLYHCSSDFIRPSRQERCGPFKSVYHAVQVLGLPIDVVREKYKNWKPSKVSNRTKETRETKEEVYKRRMEEYA